MGPSQKKTRKAFVPAVRTVAHDGGGLGFGGKGGPSLIHEKSTQILFTVSISPNNPQLDHSDHRDLPLLLLRRLRLRRRSVVLVVLRALDRRQRHRHHRQEPLLLVLLAPVLAAAATVEPVLVDARTAVVRAVPADLVDGARELDLMIKQ